MAFVRWRGNCAQLLTTVYDQGRSRQILLANLRSGFCTSPTLWAAVADQFPTIRVDWAAVDRALAQGPVTGPPATPTQMLWAGVAHQLMEWAMNPQYGDPQERAVIRQAADILTGWQSSRPS